MKRIKTQDLTGAALDWAVAKCEGLLHDDGTVSDYWQPSELWEPSELWGQGGWLIEREGISIDFDGEAWTASSNERPICHRASTPLIAAMRCYVASKLGDEIEIPQELSA